MPFDCTRPKYQVQMKKLTMALKLPWILMSSIKPQNNFPKDYNILLIVPKFPLLMILIPWLKKFRKVLSPLQILNISPNSIILFFCKPSIKWKKKKGIPATIIGNITKLSFDEGPKLMFNILNTETNGFVSLKSFLRFYRFSLLYLSIDPLSTQRLSYSQIS